MLTNIFVAVEYHDNHIKCQAWPREFIEQTDRLVFSPDLMDEPEQQAFNRINRNWRHNPCMARYLLNGKPAELICERGDDRRWRWRRSGGERPVQVRGWPVGIEFMYGDGHSYYFDENWMRDTGALEFRRDQTRSGGFAITRIELSGNKTDLDVATVGINGTMPPRVPPDSHPCWYGSQTEKTRC